MISLDAKLEIGDKKIKTNSRLRIISVREIWELRKALDVTGTRASVVLDRFGLERLEDITPDAYEEIMEELK